MDAEMKAKWIIALRSGDYDQGTGFLRNGNDFCCLGVLCDLTQSGRWIPSDFVRQPAVHAYALGKTSEGSTRYLPPDISQKFGLDEGRALSELMNMNDGGATFSEIADYIEMHL